MYESVGYYPVPLPVPKYPVRHESVFLEKPDIPETEEGKQNGNSYNNIGNHMDFIRLTISIAETIASNPLFPALLPARSTACSILSVVNTPKMTGTPALSPT